MLELGIAVAIVIVTSATCSLFEAVLYSIPVSHIERLVQEERASGKTLQRLRKNVDRPITAILGLNTIANTAGAAVAGALAVSALGDQWLVWFSAAFTVAILLFSEVIPKTAGVVYCRGLSTVIAYPLQALVWVFTPIIWLCSLITRFITGTRKEGQVSPEELVVMAKMALRTGGLVEDEAAVIVNILKLRGKTVATILTPRTVLTMLKGTLTVEEAAQDPAVYHHSRLPVYMRDKDDVVGFVHRKDILAPIAGDRADTKLSDIAVAMHFVLETTPLDGLLKVFLERRQHIVAVIDEFGALAGVVTLEDVLEEILGKEIVDESDEVADMRELARRRRDELLGKSSEQETS